MTGGEAQTLSYVRDAISGLPVALARALECPLPRLGRAPRSVVTTGVGASEGPARILAALLGEAGICARFCPASRFLAPARGPARLGASHAPAADLLIAFSQGISPNARLALGKQHAFGARWLVTSVDESCASPEKCALLAELRTRDITPIVVPPKAEPETLARFVGPTVAALTALRLAALLSEDRELSLQLAEAPSAYAVGEKLPAPLAGPLALVNAGALYESSYAHRWKLLETLLVEDPPVWDVLQFAHGPLQAFHDKRLTLLVLEGNRDAALVERLLATLDPVRQSALRLTATLPPALAFFQHAAQLDALLLATLAVAPRDLFDWPGRHGDGPLYELGATP